ncbi:MAG TPA: hypothetical protein VK935_17145 [Actinomycetospora sp.]|nr:hypothetical protein [Actinomycetospora sp.]
MRLLVVTGLTLVLLLGAVPLAVPGTPPAMSVALFLVAGCALIAGLVLLVRSRPARDSTAPGSSVPLVSAVPAPVTEYLTGRTRS